MFLIDRFTFAVFSDFYLRRGYSDQPTDRSWIWTPTEGDSYVHDCLNNIFTSMNITWASQKKMMLLHYVGEDTCSVLLLLPNKNRPKKMTNIKLPSKRLLISSSLRTMSTATSTFLSGKAKLWRKHDRVLYSSSAAGTETRVRWYPVEIKRPITQGTSSVKLSNKTSTYKNFSRTAPSFATNKAAR